MKTVNVKDAKKRLHLYNTFLKMSNRLHPGEERWISPKQLYKFIEICVLGERK